MELMQSIEALSGFIAVLALDFKGDFVDIPNRLGRDIWDHYSWADGFRIGCGPPLLCNRNVGWINQFTTIIRAHCNLQYSESVLAAAIRIALNLLQETTDQLVWPSLLLIKELIEALPFRLIARKAEYVQTVLHQLDHLLGTSGDLFSAEHGFDLFEHLIKPRRCAVIDCTMLSPLLSQILVNLIALQFLFVRITLRQVSNQTMFMLIIDESDSVCSREASNGYPQGYSHLGLFTKQAREFDGSAILGVNFLGNCSRFIQANMNTYIILDQSDPDSAIEGAKTLLEPSAYRVVSSNSTGEGFFKESMGPVPYAMLMRADHVPASKLPRPEKFNTHDYTPARGIDDIPGFRERLDQFIAQYKKTDRRQKTEKTKGSALGKTDRKFLDYMSLHEYEPLSAVFSHMPGLSNGAQQKILEDLTRRQFIQSVRERSGRIWLRFGKITDTGWKYLGKQPQLKPLRGDLPHTCICYAKRDLDLKHGLESSKCEAQIEGHNGFHDIISRLGDRYFITEVVNRCESNVCKHVRDCFVHARVNVEKLTIVTLLKSEHQKILTTILSEADLVFFASRITFTTAAEIFKELYK